MIHEQRFVAPNGEYLQMYVVKGRALRILLRIEWVSLPLGGGLCTGSLMAAVFDGWHGATAYTLFSAIPVLLVGLWRPWHRRLGFTRRTVWRAP
jgi:hypothetical protein